MKFPEMRIVEASAGSGKTYALARRYVLLLLEEGARPEEILAITFTNAAARDMKEKILDLLKEIALGGRGNDDGGRLRDILSSLSGNLRLVRGRALDCVTQIIRNYSSFRVQTIDSFINVMLSACASRLGISAEFAIRRDSEKYLRAALDECIDEANRDAGMRRLFENFLHQYLWLEERGGWFPRRELDEVVRRLYETGARRGGEFAVSNSSPGDLLQKRRCLRELVALLGARLPEGSDGRFVRSCEKLIEENPAAIDPGAMGAYFDRDEFPSKKGFTAPSEISLLWKRIRSCLREIAEGEARAVFDPYLFLFERVMGRFRARAVRDDLVFLDELNLRAAELFSGDGVSVPEIYIRLAGRFRHYLIDEFQDTSRLQWGNLAPMVEEALSTGGSLFYVGDRKQAIYRFRGGDISLFDEVPLGLPGARERREYLIRNYRSARMIVEFNNIIFSPRNLRRFILSQQPEDDGSRRRLTERDIDAVISIFRRSRQRQCGREGGYVGVERIEEVPGGDLMEAVRARTMAIIAELRGRFGDEEIAVLVRDNKQVEEVTAWLLEEGIGVESEKTLDIRRNPRIKELVSLLRFLDSPVDNLAFASFILGEIFLRSSGIARGDVEEFLISSGSLRGAYLYTRFRSRYPGVWERHIEGFFRTAGFVPLYELTVRIMREYELFARFPGCAGFFMRFLQLIKDREEEDWGIGEFLRYLAACGGEDPYVESSGADAVKVMTVHAAKGLEFPAVLLPLARFSPRPEGCVLGMEGNRIRLVRLDKKYTRFSDTARDLYRNEYRNTMVDELNVLYVACTRAKEELRLLIPMLPERGGNAASQLFPARLTGMGRPAARRRHRRAGAEAVNIPPQLYADPLGVLRDEGVDEGRITRASSLLRGEILHAILSRIGNLEGGDRTAALDAASAMVGRLTPLAFGLEEYRSAVRKLLDEESLAPFFRARGGEVYVEKEIADPEGRGMRIDRLIVWRDSVWVVDFKSSGDEGEAQRDQVRRYMRAVGEIYPGRAVRGFIITMDDRRVEEVGDEESDHVRVQN